MERIKTVLEKLNRLVTDNAALPDIAEAADQLRSELSFLQADNNSTLNYPANIPFTVMPVKQEEALKIKHTVEKEAPEETVADKAVAAEKETEKPEEPETAETEPENKEVENEDAPVYEVLEVDEAEIEAELEEIKKNAEARNNMSFHTPAAVMLVDNNGEDDFPTLTQQDEVKEVNTTVPAAPASLNDRLKTVHAELNQAADEPVKDLKKAISINDRMRYISELFKGDENMYDRSIMTINKFNIFPEAEFWIRREVKLKLGWNEKSELVKDFDQLVRRRFSH